jgi:TatD family-associated radical SAM protein
LRLNSEPSPSDIIQELQNILKEKDWTEAVFCGFGEPTIRLNSVLTISRWLKNQTNLIVRLNTNGHAFLLNKQKDIIEKMKNAGIKKISISLNGHNKKIYEEICRPKVENAYENVLFFIKASCKALDTEVTAVTNQKVNLQAIKEYAYELGASFREREFQIP